MDTGMMGMCGNYCGSCKWKDEMDCPGCQQMKGRVFWGECRIAKCVVEKGHMHCGLCPHLVCAQLRDAFSTPGHEDHGERLANLKAWAEGNLSFIEIGTYSPEKSK